MKLEEIGELLGLTREGVRQIEATASARLAPLLSDSVAGDRRRLLVPSGTPAIATAPPPSSSSMSTRKATRKATRTSTATGAVTNVAELRWTLLLVVLVGVACGRRRASQQGGDRSHA